MHFCYFEDQEASTSAATLLILPPPTCMDTVCPQNPYT